MPSLTSRCWAEWGALCFAIGLAAVMYAPAVHSAFHGDDYIYLLSARDMAFWDYFRAAAVPGADTGTLSIAQDYWRPLTFLLFRGLYSLFGDNTTGYHLVGFGTHAAGVVLVWLLARRLVRRSEATVLATLTFAVHPAGFASITWISALNSAALPFALGGWLAFVAGAESRDQRYRYRMHALSVALIAIALGFRETGSVVLPAMAAWYLLVPARERWREPRTYRAFVPYAALAVVYALASTAFFTHTSERLASLNGDSFHQGWYYLRQALLPTDQTGSLAVTGLQQAARLAVLAIPVVAAVRKRWLLLALSVGFLASIVPYALFNLGFGARYFYFPSAFLALALGAVAAELRPLLSRLAAARPLVPAAAMAGVVVAAAGVAVLGNQRVGRWVDQYATSEQRWVDALRRTYPELPAGGTLYATNIPFEMALFNGYVVEPTVSYLYPGAPRKVQVFFRADLEAVRPWLEPRDRLFVFGE